MENKLVYNHDESLFLQGLTRCRKEAISDTVNAIILPSPVPALMKAGDKNPNIIYERSYYQHLISALTSKSLIVGTSYTGKTSFLYYVLIRLVGNNIKSSVFDPLLSTCPGSDQRLKVVLYRIGSDLTLYFLDELKAYKYKNIDNDYRLVNCFDSAKILCLYDNKEWLTTVRRTNEVISVLAHNHYPIIITATPPEINTFILTNTLRSDKTFRMFTFLLWSLPDLSSVYMYNKTGLRYDVPKSQNYDHIA